MELTQVRPIFRGCAYLAVLLATGATAAPEPQGSNIPGDISAITGDPDLTARIEPTAIIFLADIGVEGDFIAGVSTVIRSRQSHECVARVNIPPLTGPGDTAAGRMTLTSPNLPAPLIIDPDPATGLTYFAQLGAPPFLFNADQRQRVSIETSGSLVDPPLPLTRLHSAPVTFVEVFTPVLPPDGVIVVDSTKPFEITWQVPSEPSHEPGDHKNKLVVSLWSLAGATSIGEVRCGFDLDKGRGVVPASLLREVKARVQPLTPITTGALRVLVGDRKEVRAGGVSYVIELGPFSTPATNIPLDNPAILQ